MDWDLPALRDLTIQVEFIKNKRVQKVRDIIGSGLEVDVMKSDADILNLFGTPPIINRETIYVSVMRCDTGSIGTYVL